jgi:hypothetical protein
MSYITSFEEFGIAQGRRQEIERSIFRTLRARFGTEAAETVAPRLSRLSLNQLEALAETALVATSLDAVITAVTELEVEQGHIAGLIDGLALALEMRFGEVSPSLIEAIRQLTDRTVIETLMAEIKTAQTLDDVWQALIVSSD